jgi:hypothetical protein
MERRENNVRVRLWAILFCVPVILLLSAPACWSDTDYNDGNVHEVKSPEPHLNINTSTSIVPGTTVNLSADISGDIIVGPNSFLNIYSGNVVGYVSVHPTAVVTVYGTNFVVDGVPLDPSVTNFSVGVFSDKRLTGQYGDEDKSDIDLLFKNYYNSNVFIYLKDPVTNVEQVGIDIKPGSYPNSINLKSNGVVPVAVLTAGGFDAATVDPTTVEFTGVSPLRWTLCDVDDDGDEDMVFHFKTQELKLDENSTEAELTGQTYDEVHISGTDEVRIVPPKPKNTKNKKKK